MKETTKSTQRRMEEDAAGVFPWRQIFTGRGLDVGAGDDPLQFPGCQPFDKGDGDANTLSRYFAPEMFDYIHASHCAEHLHDPSKSIRDWLTLVKPLGHIVLTVPDVGAYERFTCPSRYNPDHKSSWSMIYLGSSFPIHVHIPTWVKQFDDVAITVLARYVERNYNWKLKPEFDQTWTLATGCEIWNEIVFQKRL